MAMSEAAAGEPGLAIFLDAAGRIKRWPKKKAEKLLVLRYLAAKCQTGRRYSEAEINDIIRSWHVFNDHALLRREMFNNFLLGRTPDGREYWVEG